MSERKISESLRVLLTEIIDYAGLFPPSELTMARAVQNYAEYLQSKHAWMLGRFVCPAARLAEFGEHAIKLLDGKKIWRLSALAGEEDLAADLIEIEKFNQTHKNRCVIDSIEIKATKVEEIKNAKEILPAELIAYFELPLKTMYWNELITSVAVNRLRAKIRTGGTTQEAFPPVDEAIKFARICVAANVPFKATAGLHHPVRCSKPLTYEENAPVGTMHGFLNLFLATAFLRQNLNASFANRVMSETEANNFRFDDESVEWEKHRIDLQQIKLMRERNAVSFGSCSFTEPIEDLRQLGLL